MNTALNTPLSPGMRELTLDEIDQVEGGGLKEQGQKLMTAAGVMAAIGALTPIIPDGEAAAAITFIVGATMYIIGDMTS